MIQDNWLKEKSLSAGYNPQTGFFLGKKSTP
jgi:hypothetical protein